MGFFVAAVAPAHAGRRKGGGRQARLAHVQAEV
jgi:hypothetical protein